MTGVILATLIAFVLVQYPLGRLVGLDARRLGIKNPGAYEYGTMQPLVGYVVLAAYVWEREELSKPERATASNDG